MNIPFLHQVARHYLDAPNLEDYCFVFPNRRSGQFFVHYLTQDLIDNDHKSSSIKPHLLPRVTSINDLVSELTNTVTATDIEMMFALYDAYCQAFGDNAQEFDKFIYWAQLIIGDFNDLDKSLNDADAIFKHLDEMRSLSSNYLTEEVLEQVKAIFGDSLYASFFNTDADADLWRNHGSEEADTSKSKDDKVKQEFVTLWNALSVIYDNYHKVLESNGVVSSGRQLRMAAEASSLNHSYSRLIFVGFGVLSAAEVKLFDHFKSAQIADFWWDNAGIDRLLATTHQDPAVMLIDGYCKHFGAMPLEPVDNKSQTVRAVAVPSTVGQAKQAFDEVALMRGQSTTPVGIETAIVLPDESLLVPLLHSVHGVDVLNVTLGYPLRSSGIVSLMHIVARMHNQASKERGRWTYYREDVYDILSHPLIKTFFTNEALTLVSQLSNTNRFRVPANEFNGLAFSDLFVPAMDSEQGDEQQQTGYLDHLLNFCNVLMDRMNEATGKDGGNVKPNQEGGVALPLQQAFLVMYIDVLNQLKHSLMEHGQSLQRSSVFYLIDRLSSSSVVPFTGEPIQGMQVMGLLETRNLDFKNVVVLSMNERVFPRRKGINSFIPNYIRRAYGMSTLEQQEAIVAFNFYRLLNRAEHVSLVYDSSVQSMGSGEPSRYIAQLEMIYGRHIDHVEMNPVVQTSSNISISVPNEGYDTLRESYLKHHSFAAEWYLSASAINKYINCPLNFYLHYIQGLNDDNETGDFMDSGTFGTIVHDTLADCYNSKEARTLNGVITREYIESFQKKLLNSTVVRNIKKTYLHVSKDKLDDDRSPLRGEAFMLMDTIKSYVNFVLDYDKELIDRTGGAFTILECEETHDEMALSMGKVAFNFTYKPDRVDRLADGTVRIVDYKTGDEPTAFSSLDDLFDPSKKKRCKGILQLMLYCYAYLMKNEEVSCVMPSIYKIAAMKDSGVNFKPTGRGATLRQFVFSLDNEICQDFIARMAMIIQDISMKDFVQCEEDAKACDYCRFIDYCRRTTKSRDY